MQPLLAYQTFSPFEAETCLSGSYEFAVSLQFLNCRTLTIDFDLKSFLGYCVRSIEIATESYNGDYFYPFVQIVF